MSQDPFPYMRWARTHLNAAWGPRNLGMSGARPPSAELRASWGLPPTPEVGDAAEALKEAVAAWVGVVPEAVHPTAGSSHANFITYLTLAQGAHILVEDPAYEALPALAAAVGATHAPLRRNPGEGWRFDPADLSRQLTPETALIVVTDLHNPSGQRLHPDDLDLLCAAAEQVDAYVLVDEVYLAFDAQQRPSAALHHPRVLSTNSLTKSHGLGELRCGWVLGDPDVIRRIEAWDDLVHPEQPASSLAAGAAYLPHAPERTAALRAEAAPRIEQVDAWAATTPGVTWTKPHGGLTGFLALGAPGAPLEGDHIAARLLEKHGIRAVSGSFFQRPHYLRVSYMLEPEELAAALDAIADVLAEVLADVLSEARAGKGV